MINSDILKLELIRIIFENNKIIVKEIKPDEDFSRVYGWDSHVQVILFLLLEEKYNIFLPREKIVELLSIESIMEIINE